MNAQTALVMSDSKAAALYFDHVVPLFAQSVVDGFTSSEVKAGVLSVLTPERFLERLKTLYEPLNQERVLERLKTLAPDVLLSDGSLRMEYLTLLRHLADTQSMVAVLDQSMDAVLGLFREGSLSVFGSLQLSVAENSEEDTVSFVLSNLKLVDASKLSWEQVLEVRRDEKSMAKLRSLRVLFHENYSGKPSSYIEDDLLSRVDKYDETVKEWKLDTVERSLEMFCSSKSLKATAVAVIAAAFWGGIPLTELAGPAIAGSALKSVKSV